MILTLNVFQCYFFKKMTRRGQWFLMFYLDFYSSAISPKIEQVLYFQNMTLEFRLVVTRPSCLTNQK